MEIKKKEMMKRKTNKEKRAEKVKEFVLNYKNRGTAVKKAIDKFGFSRSTIYEYLSL